MELKGGCYLQLKLKLKPG